MAGRASTRLRRFTQEVAEYAPRPADCTVASIDRWVATLSTTGVRSLTVHQYVYTVHGFTRWLLEKGHIAEDPIRPRCAAAPGWSAALKAYLKFVEAHRGVATTSLSSWLRRFTRDVAEYAPRAVDCTIACIDRWVLEVSTSDVRAGSLRHYVSAVRGFMRWLRDEGYIARDIASMMLAPWMWREANVPGHFTWDEVRKLVASIPAGTVDDLRDRALVLLFAACGLRAGEAARITLNDVDFERNTVRLQQRKTGDFLLLPLPWQAVEALRKYVESRTTPGNGVLFLTSQQAPFRSGSALSTHLRRLAARAGLGSSRGAQALRRAVGTRMVERGASLPEVALMLGHHGVETTRDYVRVSMAMLAEVADNYAELM